MKELQLTDRVVVEVHGEECTLEQMAAALRAVAEMIEQCRKGGEFPIGNKGNLLWEHESKDNGGFRMGNKSFICMHYYGSEQKPKVISDELMDSIIEFNKDYDEQFEKIGEDIYTKTDFLEDAARLLSQVEQENK